MSKAQTDPNTAASLPAPAAQRQTGKIFYGWWIVLASGMALFVNTGIGFYAIGIFYKPLEDEFAWPRSSIAGAMSVAVMVMSGMGPFTGRWSDRRGVRGLMICGAVVMGSALMGLYFIDSLWQWYLAFVVLAIGRAAFSVVPVSTAISNWFIERRGFALGLSMAGFGIGGLVLVPFASLLVSVWGWRVAMFVLGIVTVVVAIPPVVFLMKTRPSDVGLRPYGADSPEANSPVEGHQHPSRQPSDTEWTLGQFLRTATFWLMVLSLSLVFLCQAALLLHTVPLLTDRGLTLSIASLVLSITAGVGTVGKLTMGAIADRIPAKYVLSLCFTLQVIGLLILMVAGTSWAIWLYALVFGMGMGGVIAVQPALIGECFGVRSFGLVFGTMQIFTASFNALGPVFAAWIYDTAGSYFWALIFCGVCGMASAATILLVRQPKQKAALPALRISEG